MSQCIDEHLADGQLRIGEYVEPRTVALLYESASAIALDEMEDVLEDVSKASLERLLVQSLIQERYFI